MAHGTDHHPKGYKQYFAVWGALLAMTLIALVAGYAEMSASLKALILVGITLGKIGVIAWFFMHLKFERINLVILTITPILLALILFFFTFGETGGSSTHILMVR